MNGNIGRARTLARIRRERRALALAAGVDPQDRVAMSAFLRAENVAFYERLRREIQERRVACSI